MPRRGRLRTTSGSGRQKEVRIDPLTLFGLVAISFMLLCYLLESRSAWWTLGFAAGCLASSAYGFLQGAWPFGAVELIWTGVALYRWRGRLRLMEPIA